MASDLFDAAKNGDVNEVRRLVRAGADPEAIHGALAFTPLHVASERGHLPVVEYLVGEVRVDVDKRDADGRTAVFLACANSHLALIEYLVEHGRTDVEARDAEGNTILHTASSYGSLDVCLYLVEQLRVDVDAEDESGITALEHGCDRTDRLDIVRCLLPRVSSLSERALETLWKYDSLADYRVLAFEKHSLGRGLGNAFRQNPIHTALLLFPYMKTKAFQDCINLFPASVLCLPDEQGRLCIHVALSCAREFVSLLFEREPRLALGRDPTTGLFPHETAAGQAAHGADNRGWLDIAYKMLRYNPQRFLRSRESCALSDEEERVGEPMASTKRQRLM